MRGGDRGKRSVYEKKQEPDEAGRLRGVGLHEVGDERRRARGKCDTRDDSRTGERRHGEVRVWATVQRTHRTTN